MADVAVFLGLVLSAFGIDMWMDLRFAGEGAEFLGLEDGSWILGRQAKREGDSGGFVDFQLLSGNKRMVNSRM